MFTVLNFCVFAFMLCVSCAQTLSRVRLFATPWTVSLQAPLSMGFPSPEYWSGLPFPSPGDLPSPGIKPESPESPALGGRSFTTGATWEALRCFIKSLESLFLCEDYANTHYFSSSLFFKDSFIRLIFTSVSHHYLTCEKPNPPPPVLCPLSAFQGCLYH